jgi:DNA-binding MarR family transcriptional regulator
MLMDWFYQYRSVIFQRTVAWRRRREKFGANMARSKLGLDRGYLSRILHRFAACGLVRMTGCKNDGRQKVLELTGKGRKAHSLLNKRAQRHVVSILKELSRAEQNRLVAAMRTIEKLMGSKHSATS